MTSLWRFSLQRKFDPCPAVIPGRRMLFVMLNPSTADATQDDPTIRRCKGFALGEGCEFLEVVNLFAWRATNPRDLIDQPDRATIFERATWNMALKREPWRIVAGWGDSGPGWLKQKVHARIPQLIEVLNNHGRIMHALGTTKSGMPRHPLYLPKDSELEPWTCPMEILR